MKVVAIIVLLVAFMACSLAQPMGMAGAGTQQGQQMPNFLQFMLMQNMFDSQWLPAMFMTGGGGARNLLPLLMWGNM